MDRAGPRKILRSPSLKRKSRPVPLTERVGLEKVLGLNVACNAAIDVCPATGTVAYPSGCVVVLLNSKKNRQAHIFNVSKKTITAVAFSHDGKYLVTGECGHQPAVRVWDADERTQTTEFHGHKFGIHCVAFSPNMKYIVSIGTQHDMIVSVWDWKAGCKFASNKVSSKVSNLAFSADGSHFVTVGLRHVKFWYLEATKSKIKETVPLHGRASILGDQRNNFFTDVACGIGANSDKTYSITQSGLLCEFNSKRLLTAWVKLRTKIANALALSENEIFIGCADGIVRVFDANTLKFVTTLPRPHYIGIDVAAGLDPSHMLTYPSDAKYPHTLALVYDGQNKKMTSVYDDHSLYIWDVRDLRKVGKIWSHLYHSHCVWGIEMYPTLSDDRCPALPAGSFITCSSDDTIRVWNLEPNMAANTNWKRNIYSHELLKIIYTDPEYNFICDVDYNPAGGTDKTDTGYVGKNGVRSIRVSADGQHLASGDRVGNIRVYDLRSMEMLCLVEAHDGEVLALEYCHARSDTSLNLLASASRDRLIHVFDVTRDYALLHTLDDHSSSITAVKFVDFADKLQLISCGADKSLLFRNAVKGPDSELQFSLHRHLVGKTTLYDMDVDPGQKFLATACQDRNVRIYNIATGKQRKCYKGSLGDDGTLIKVQIDPSGTLMAASSSDKNLCVMDFYTGDCLSTMYGHSEIAPGIQFMNDMHHLVSVSGDGCSFVWKLHADFTQQMLQRMTEKEEEQMLRVQSPSHVNNHHQDRYVTVSPGRGADLSRPRAITSPLPLDHISPERLLPPKSDSPATKYSFSVGQLPTWAKKQVLHEEVDLNSPLTNPSAPRGRWAQRLDDDELVIRGEGDARIPLSFFNSLDRRRYTIEPDVIEADIYQLRRQTVVLDRANGPDANLPILMMDEDAAPDDDEYDEFSGVVRSRREDDEQPYTHTFVSSPQLGVGDDANDSPRRLQRFVRASPGPETAPLSCGDGVGGVAEQDDEDDVEEQVIYYPAVLEENDDDDDDLEVAAEVNGQLAKLNVAASSVDSSSDIISISSADGGAVCGDGVNDCLSDDDVTEEALVSSAVGTPLTEHHFITDHDAKEELFRKTIEGSSSTESVHYHAPGDLSPTHRQSLSSRFLSRTQQSQIRQAASQVSAQDGEISSVDRVDASSPPTKLAAQADPANRDSSDARGTNPNIDYSRTTGSLRRKPKNDDPRASNKKRQPPDARKPERTGLRKAFSTTDLNRPQHQAQQHPLTHSSSFGPRLSSSKVRTGSSTRDRSSSSPPRGRLHQTQTESTRRRNTGPSGGHKSLTRTSSNASLDSQKADDLRRSLSSVLSSPKTSPRRQNSSRRSAPSGEYNSQPSSIDETDMGAGGSVRSSAEVKGARGLSPTRRRRKKDQENRKSLPAVISDDRKIAPLADERKSLPLKEDTSDRRMMPPPTTAVVAKTAKSDSFMRFASKSLKSSSRESKSKRDYPSQTDSKGGESTDSDSSDRSSRSSPRVTFSTECTGVGGTQNGSNGVQESSAPVSGQTMAASRPGSSSSSNSGGSVFDVSSTADESRALPMNSRTNGLATSNIRITTSDDSRTVYASNGLARSLEDLSPSPVEMPVKDSANTITASTYSSRARSPSPSPQARSPTLRARSPTVRARSPRSPLAAGSAPRSRRDEERPPSPMSTISSDLRSLITASVAASIVPASKADHVTDSQPIILLKSPDRSRLSLPLLSSHDQQHTLANDVQDDCHQAIGDMKRAVLRASHVYRQVDTGGVVLNGERQHLMSILNQAFREVRTALVPFTNDDDAEQSAAAAAHESVKHGAGAADDSEFMTRLEPILDHYTAELSDRVLAIVEERLADMTTEKKKKDKAALETDF